MVLCLNFGGKVKETIRLKAESFIEIKRFGNKIKSMASKKVY